MGTKNRHLTTPDRIRVDFTTTASLISLSLAQGFLILAVWLLAWPSIFTPPIIGYGFVGVTGFLSGLSLIGFYLGFISLWRNSGALDR